MSEEPTRYDPYGLSDIEKIQQEIEKDLQAYRTVALSDTAMSLTPDSTDTAASEVISTDETAVEAPCVCAEAVTPAPVESAAFYRETIKENAPMPRRRRMSWRRKVTVACIVCTLGTGTLGMGIGAGIPLMGHYLSGGIETGNQGENANDSAYGIESTRYVFSSGTETIARDGTLSDVIKLVEPSVVSVSSLFESANAFAMGQSSGDGSGIIFSEDAQKVYIATNYHVVNGASAVNVSITGSTPLPAKLVGRDAEADLAVISVEKKSLSAAGLSSIAIAVFGDSDDMEVGDGVLAIGNAMGEGNSATYGIISAKEKTIPIQNRNLTVLQTDAAINFGNSGGPLVNTRGEVIGINTAKLSDNYYAVEGMGYSISSNIAKPILEELMTSGARPFLGIEGLTVTEEVAAQFDIPPIGVFVSSVLKNTGAEKAGILRTDIITSFNGNAVFTMNQLAEEVKKCKVGDTVEVKLLREGKTPMTIQVKLGDQNDDNF